MSISIVELVILTILLVNQINCTRIPIEIIQVSSSSRSFSSVDNSNTNSTSRQNLDDQRQSRFISSIDEIATRTPRILYQIGVSFFFFFHFAIENRGKKCSSLITHIDVIHMDEMENKTRKKIWRIWSLFFFFHCRTWSLFPCENRCRCRRSIGSRVSVVVRTACRSAYALTRIEEWKSRNIHSSSWMELYLGHLSCQYNRLRKSRSKKNGWNV